MRPHFPSSTASAAARVRQRVEALAEPMAEHQVSNLDVDTRAVLQRRTAIALSVVVLLMGSVFALVSLVSPSSSSADYPAEPPGGLTAATSGVASSESSTANPAHRGQAAASAAHSGVTASVSSEPGAASEPTEVVVSVQGMVARPGLVRTTPQRRVGEVIDLAGGPHPRARLHGINLAEIVTDGMQITLNDGGSEVRYPGIQGSAHVPPGGTGVQGGMQRSAPPEGPGAGASTAIVSINSADAQLLQTLPGIGPATAHAIVSHRDSHGPFTSVEQLMEVKGIGPAKFEAIKDAITL